MKQLTKTSLFFALMMLLTLSSCQKNEVTDLSISKSAITLKVGLSDTLVTTASWSGDISKQPMTLTSSDTTIATVKEIAPKDVSINKSGSLTKSIAIKAHKAGTTNVTVEVGGKTAITTVTVTQTTITFNQISAINYGPVLYDLYDIDNNYYSVKLTSGTAAYNSVTSQYSGTGKILVMDLMTPLSSNNIAQGNYSATETADAYTFFPGSSDGQYYYPSIIIDVINGVRTFQIISDGTFTVTKNSDVSFLIQGDLNSGSDGIVHFSYNGNITPVDKQIKDQTSTFTSGSLNYYADVFVSGKSNTYKLNLKSSADSVSLFVNTTLTAKDSIPSGKYPVITLPVTLASQLEPYTIIPGSVEKDNTSSYLMGSWYWGTDNLRLETGFANISRIGSNYNISYEMYSHFGVKFTGTYSGPLVYTNKSSGVAPAKVKGLANAKSVIDRKMIDKTLLNRVKY